MTAVWLAVPAVLVVGVPLVVRALARAAREAAAARSALATLTRDLTAAAGALGDASGAFASSVRAFQDDVTR